MPKYLLSYHGGDFPQEMTETVDAAWAKWMDGVGAKAIDRGGPLKPSKTVGEGGKVTDNGGANEVTGYSVIEAASMEEALAIAKNCPQIGAPHENGTVEVGELMG
jgi:hypothetical protein